MSYPLIRHPDRFTWDFWYHFDPDEQVFHLLYLNADPALVPGDRHHNAAQVGYAITRDFTSIDWIDDDVFHARKDGWDNRAIWSGDVISTRDGCVMFYTSRDGDQDDGMTQQVGIAVSQDFRTWERVEGFRLAADPAFYEVRSVEGDAMAHAWRDPFLFRDGGDSYMVIVANSRSQPLRHKGSVGLLRSVDGSLTRWEALPPAFSPGTFSQCEVPQVYRKDGRLVVVFSCLGRFCFDAETGGLHAAVGPPVGEIDAGFDAPAQVILPESEGLYAARVIPELGGDIVGFDLRLGGLRRVPAQTGYQHVDRDFSMIGID
ncbi:MAG: glycoside hydrolase family 68 protein [Anaerolineae bacterium]|nr:glycoside hydrolase family 68 protein [Anaerolineae bacterium]